MSYLLTLNLKARDASASKKAHFIKLALWIHSELYDLDETYYLLLIPQDVPTTRLHPLVHGGGGVNDEAGSFPPLQRMEVPFSKIPQGPLSYPKSSKRLSSFRRSSGGPPAA